MHGCQFLLLQPAPRLEKYDLTIFEIVDAGFVEYWVKPSEHPLSQPTQSNE